ncbi:MAG: hypothetical protein PWQ57_629 [Desulfovibrionales bacterium]|jgi:hypothetical protein|nr:hypothetical protein [Desulfovibrionales bacterium]
MRALLRFAPTPLILLMAPLLLQGCWFLAAGAVAGSGAFAYYNGWVARDYNTSVSSAYEASLQACSSLGVKVTKKEKELASASITGKDGDSDVWITVKQIDQKTVKIEVKAGIIGDKQAAENIHAAITRHL